MNCFAFALANTLRAQRLFTTVVACWFCQRPLNDTTHYPYCCAQCAIDAERD
jgi:endogenous inhibitor of DNA gyrase (YacG/DUF329 family)